MTFLKSIRRGTPCPGSNCGDVSPCSPCNPDGTSSDGLPHYDPVTQLYLCGPGYTADAARHYPIRITINRNGTIANMAIDQWYKIGETVTNSGGDWGISLCAERFYTLMGYTFSPTTAVYATTWSVTVACKLAVTPPTGSPWELEFPPVVNNNETNPLPDGDAAYGTFDPARWRLLKSAAVKLAHLTNVKSYMKVVSVTPHIDTPPPGYAPTYVTVAMNWKFSGPRLTLSPP